MTSILSNMNNHGPPHGARGGVFGYDFAGISTDDFNDTSDIPPVNGPPLLNHHEIDFLGDFFDAAAQGTGVPGLDFSSTMHGHDLSRDQDFDFLLQEPTPSLVSASVMSKALSPMHTMHGLPGSSDFGFNGLLDSHDVGHGSSHNDMLSANSILDAHAALQQPRLHIAPPTLQHSQSMTNNGESAAATTGPSYLSLQSAPALSPSHQAFNFRMPISLSHLDTSVSHTQDFHFDGSRSAPPGQPRSRLADEISDARYYRFGTDTHFSSSGFQHEERGDKLEKKMLRDLYIIKPEYPSKDSTRAPTPENLESKKRIREVEDHAERPAEVKRVKSDVYENGHERDNRFAVQRASSQPGGETSMSVTPPTKLRRMPSSADANKHRRRNSSSGAAAKASRENLSEEQKRSNHIMSEQKRRNLIKAGFDDLHTLVPELRQGGLSKSNVLVEAANFLEQLMTANAEMRRRLGKTE